MENYKLKNNREVSKGRIFDFFISNWGKMKCDVIEVKKSLYFGKREVVDAYEVFIYNDKFYALRNIIRTNDSKEEITSIQISEVVI
jgi:hypothetical protein